MTSQLMGAILAAGRGSRMAPFGEAIPKAVMPIGNRPLVEYQIEQMRGLGISEIAILIGHKGYEISKALGDGERLGVRLTYVEQTVTAGIAHALGRLEPVLTKPFVLMLGDIFFEPRNLPDLVTEYEQHRCNAVLAAKREPDLSAIRKNFAILQDESGRVRRVIEKPRHPQNDLKGVGLYLFDPVVFDSIRRTPRTAMRDEYELTEAIQVMIDDEWHVRVSDCIANDINLTFPSDVLKCNLHIAANRGAINIIDQTAILHPEAVIDRVVVGRRAVVKSPITIRRSVILDNAVVDSTEDLDGFIISPSQIVDCRPEIAGWPAGLTI